MPFNLIAYRAVNGGADRLELCGNLGLGGGTTPSMGLLKAVHRAVPHTSIMVMIRPRTGDFLYSAAELDVMLEDIRAFKQSGLASGIVLGILTSEGRVDVERTKSLADEALPLEVCFHRAFDMTRNGEEAYMDLASIQAISRILTSGLGPSAPSCISTLRSLFSISKQKGEGDARRRMPKLLVGSGINSKTVKPVLDELLPHGLQEIHLSGGLWIDSKMTHRPPGMNMGAGDNCEWCIWTTSESAVKTVRAILDYASGHA